MSKTEHLVSIKEALEKNGVYTGLTSGTSMEPLILHQKDNIIVVRPAGRLKKYDIPVYVSPSGKYIMHRIVAVKPDHYIIIGDNLLRKEYVTDDMIIGVLRGFYKNGRRYVDLDKNRLYKLYSRLWVALYPLRPLYVYGKRAVRKLIRILKRSLSSE